MIRNMSVLILTAIATSPVYAEEFEEGSYVCVREWGASGDEGYCGRINRASGNNVEIRIKQKDGTYWNTNGNHCSGGENLKSLRKNQLLWVSRSCLKPGTAPHYGAGTRLRSLNDIMNGDF